MTKKHLTRDALAEKVIDVHSHVGVAIKEYSAAEYPYAQTAAGLYYQQLAGGVDVNVVFPFSADLYFEPSEFRDGKKVRARQPLSETPFQVENLILMREVFDYLPLQSHRFITFASFDPGRDVSGQLTALERLEANYPIYGIKINPTICQSRVTELLGRGEAFLDFAQQRGLPLLFHSTTAPNDEFSQASDILRIAEKRPEVRFCLAHGLLFHKKMLERAASCSNVWVDTAAMKIQVDLASRLVNEGVFTRADLIDADFSDHTKVMATLCESFPKMILWGTDSPAYTYHCRRKQGENIYEEFSLEGTYEDEIAALNALPPGLRDSVCNQNTLEFLFGPLL